MENLDKIRTRCKGAVSITFNGHRNYNATIRDHIAKLIGSIEDASQRSSDPEELVSPEMLEQMEVRDSLVEVVAFPDTPEAFAYVAHWDLNAALEEMLEALGLQTGPTTDSV